MQLAKLRRTFRATGLPRAVTRKSTDRLISEADDAIAEYVCDHFVPLRAPLILVSQVQRSGGSLVSQLFDGHPQIAAYPHELKIGYPSSEHWIRIPRSATKSFGEMYKGSQARLVRKGFSKGLQETARYPFLLSARAQERIFHNVWPRDREATRRDAADAYFTSFFNAWLNYRGDVSTARYITAFAPRMANHERSVHAFFETYPDGYLVQILRDPIGWFASSRGHKRWGRASVEEIAQGWVQSAQAIARNKREFGDRVIVLNFETLLADPERTMRALCDRFEIAYDASLSDPTFNRMPVRANSSYAVHAAGIIDEPRDRRRQVSDADAVLIEKKCGALRADVLQLAGVQDG